MGLVVELPPTPVFSPPPTTPPVGPGPGGPLVLLFQLVLWLEAMEHANDGALDDPGWFGWLTDPLEARRRTRVAVMCKDCCDIARKEGEKTIRKIGANLDKVSPKTSDNAKRARLRKRTRNPAW